MRRLITIVSSTTLKFFLLFSLCVYQVVVGQHQRTLLSSANPRYIVSLDQLRNMVQQVQQATETYNVILTQARNQTQHSTDLSRLAQLQHPMQPQHQNQHHISPHPIPNAMSDIPRPPLTQPSPNAPLQPSHTLASSPGQSIPTGERPMVQLRPPPTSRRPVGVIGTPSMQSAQHPTVPTVNPPPPPIAHASTPGASPAAAATPGPIAVTPSQTGASPPRHEVAEIESGEQSSQSSAETETID